VLIALGLSACTATAEPAAPAGAVSVSVDLSALQAASVTRVVLRVTAGARAVTQADLSQDSTGRWSTFLHEVEAAPDYVYAVQLLDAQGTVLYQGAVSAAVVAGQTTTVSILAQSANPAPGPVIDMPVLDLLTATDILAAPGGTITLAVSAHDPGGLPLAYAWTDTCGGGFLPPDGATTTWTRPPSAAPGPCTLSLRVVAGVAAVTVDLPVQIVQ
jgi:hypothetical protein